MSAGKAAAQATHATMMLQERGNWFADRTRRTVIVLEAENAQQITNLWEYLDNAGILAEYYIDEGANEVGAYSITAMAVEPFSADDEEKRQIFESFDLYTGEGNKYEDAYKALNHVARGFRSYDFMTSYDGTPRFMRKTLKWLAERF